MPKGNEIKLLPLKKFVCEWTGEATVGDQEAIRKAAKSWHNRLNNGTVPRSLFKKIGKQLFVDLEAYYQWIGAK